MSKLYDLFLIYINAYIMVYGVTHFEYMWQFLIPINIVGVLTAAGSYQRSMLHDQSKDEG